ncbi:MAG TPA: hypothetical protein VF617_06390 [Sphingomonas sp.]|jgi:hypothetical protein
MRLNPFARVHHTQHNDEPELTLARSLEDMSAKTALHNETWRMDRAIWAADLDLGFITFTNERKWIITAPVQVIGTFNSEDNSWLWGWDHPSIPAPLASTRSAHGISARSIAWSAIRLARSYPASRRLGISRHSLAISLERKVAIADPAEAPSCS